MSRRGRPPHPDILTPREWEVLALLRDGLSNDEIAPQLGISLAGVKYHVSEILAKLNVPDRAAAARWQPARVAGRGFFLAPLAVLRRLHFGLAVGGVIVAAALAGVGLLAWEVVASSGAGDIGGTAPWVIGAAPASKQPSVFLFDLAHRRAEQLSMTDAVTNARWVKPGRTWVALLDANTQEIVYEVYDTGGSRVWTVPPDLTRAIVPAPGGDAVLIERTDNQYLVANIPTGKAGTFLAGAIDLAFSPNGTRAAYTTLGGSDKDNVNHDWRTIYVADKTDLTGFTGGAMAIQSQRETDGAIDLAPDPWSPDGKYLLVQKWPCPPSAFCQGPPTFEVYDTSASFHVVWNQYAGELLGAQWAGPGRLFVVFRPGVASDPAYPGVSGLIVDFAGGKTPLPSWTQSCCDTFSPDGKYAVMRVGSGNADQQRCALYDVSTWTEVAGFEATAADHNTAFCAVASWTPDDSQVIVSPGGI